MRYPNIRELLYALIIAYYEDVMETHKIVKFFRTELWNRFSKVLEENGFRVPSFNEVHKQLWDFFVNLIMDRFNVMKILEKWGIKYTVSALDYSPHKWIDGGIEVLIRLRGIGSWQEVKQKMKYEYQIAKQRLKELHYSNSQFYLLKLY